MFSDQGIQAAVSSALEAARDVPPSLWLLISVATLVCVAATFYIAVFFAAPIPRAPTASEEAFVTVDSEGRITAPQPLSKWHDNYLARRTLSDTKDPNKVKSHVEKAEIFMSVVIPAYNEQERLEVMLEEAVEYLNLEYGSEERTATKSGTTEKVRKRKQSNSQNGLRVANPSPSASGWEVLIVSDGSTDKTEEVALNFARNHSGGSIRFINLVRNRGKGGAVCHGMKYVRGEYVVFADADGASRFSDLGKLVRACKEAEDQYDRAVAVGSRAHLVGSEAVVKRSKLRNFLMHSFHVLLRLMTPPATSKIKDTQCGFKLFSRQSLPYIVPHMHSEGWIFDVEMLMLAEAAGIPMVEVHIGWKEVMGSKLNVIWDSLGMAWGLFILRAAWTIGVYRV